MRFSTSSFCCRPWWTLILVATAIGSLSTLAAVLSDHFGGLGFATAAWAGDHLQAGGPTGVRVELVEAGVTAEPKWPAAPGAVSESFDDEAFGFFRIPWRYTGTGVRADRANPLLFRATARVELPSGKLRLLLRSRSASRLTIDGATVADLPFAKPMSDGHNALRKPVLTLGQTRFVSPGNREVVVEYDSPGGDRQVTLETIVGGLDGKRPLRPELGELVVAFAPAGSDDFALVSPARHIPLTDKDWSAWRMERETEFGRLEAERRARARRRFAATIDSRHEAGGAWVRNNPPPAAPPLPKALPANTRPDVGPIDRFLLAALAEANAAGARETGPVRYHRDVQPLLAARCLSCHARKAQGGLRLDSLAAARRGGDSGEAALVPGDVDRSELLKRVRSKHEAQRMPPKGDALTEPQIALLERWIRDGAAWPDIEPAERIEPAPSADELVFLRRLFLNVVGVPPTLVEIRTHLDDPRPDRRARLIDRLLDDPRAADVWTARWQDWLGENPNLVNATLNNTGPFRYWIHESYLDNKPLDLFVRELILMDGSVHGGGPAGFGLAAQNDAPMAAKAGVLAGTFLGVEMKCARCHDAPFHDSTQTQLFQLAGLLAREPVKVPGTSTVAVKPGEGRASLIHSDLKPGDAVAGVWPFPHLLIDSSFDEPSPGGDVDRTARDSRTRLADLLTSPANERFAAVMVNRIWQHAFGRGLVEPANDWENARATHPALLTWLARELVAHRYDGRHIQRLVYGTQAWQRAASNDPAAVRVYAAMPRRRLSAEQVVDSLFASYGVPLDVGEVCIDLDGGRPPENGLNLGRPRRAWEFAYTSNDRDRPSLNLPRVRAVTELLGAFGWPEVRQEAISDRRPSADVLQAALLQNGVASRWLTRLSDDSAMTEMAVAADSSETLVGDVYLRLLTRLPTTAELRDGMALLGPGFADRHVAVAEIPPRPKRYEPYVAWSNHLDPESTVQRQKEEAEARRGPEPTARLDSRWRERFEDLLWTLLNAPEAVVSP